MDNYPTAVVLSGRGRVTDFEGLAIFKSYLDTLAGLAQSWRTIGTSQEDALATPLPGPYSSFLFQALFPGNLEVAYNQITLGC